MSEAKDIACHEAQIEESSTGEPSIFTQEDPVTVAQFWALRVLIDDVKTKSSKTKAALISTKTETTANERKCLSNFCSNVDRLAS